MKGLVRRSLAAGDLCLMDVPEPSPGPGQVKIKVEFAGICGSDVKMRDYSIAPGSKIQPPIVTGHEGVGIITEVGPDVSGLKAGDRVSAETTVTNCGVCRFCRTGHINMCLDRRGLGSRASGYFAEYTVARAQACHVIPDHVDPKGAAVLEPLACAVNAVMQRSSVKPGDVALVWGPGTIGQCVAQVAKLSGAYVVMVGTPRSRPRLEIAKQLGVDEVWVTGEAGTATIIDKVMALTGGYGADIVYEAVGSETAFTEALSCVRKLGQCVVAATSSGKYSVDIRWLFMREIQMAGAISTDPQAWDTSCNLLNRGMVNLSALATHVFPLADWEKGFDLGKNRHGIKVLLAP